MAGSAPARIFPANVTHAIRGKVTAGFIGKVEIGTLPAGAFVLRTSVHIATLFNATAPTISLGTAAAASAFAITTDIAPATAGYKPSLVGTGMGDTLTADTPVVVTVTGGTSTAGTADFVLEFYPQKT